VGRHPVVQDKGKKKGKSDSFHYLTTGAKKKFKTLSKRREAQVLWSGRGNAILPRPEERKGTRIHTFSLPPPFFLTTQIRTKRRAAKRRARLSHILERKKKKDSSSSGKGKEKEKEGERHSTYS